MELISRERVLAKMRVRSLSTLNARTSAATSAKAKPEASVQKIFVLVGDGSVAGAAQGRSPDSTAPRKR
jgi:hypothetical protein